MSENDDDKKLHIDRRKTVFLITELKKYFFQLLYSINFALYN